MVFPLFDLDVMTSLDAVCQFCGSQVEYVIVLDICAHYYDRIPLAVIDANRSAHANLTKLRDEINLLAQGMDRRNLNITNQAERTDELCHQAIAACDGTSAKVEALMKNISAQVNTQAIVDGIHADVDKGIRAIELRHQHRTIEPRVKRARVRVNERVWRDIGLQSHPIRGRRSDIGRSQDRIVITRHASQRNRGRATVTIIAD
jgi:hypothetical protein